MSKNSPQNTALQTDPQAVLAGAGLVAAAQTGPILLAKSAPWRIIWANEQAAAIFGTQDLAELTRICLTGPEPGARQLARLADTMTPAAITDMRLRLRIRGKPEMLTLSCARLSAATPFFAIAPWGYRAAAATPQTPVKKADEKPPEKRGNVRFLWRTDRDGQLISITGGLCEVVGCDPPQLIGKDFLETLNELKIDAGGRLAAALSRRDTWSGIEVLWPIANSATAAPVILGALPGFDRARSFDGFSGFGVIHLDQIRDNPAFEPDIAVVKTAADAGAQIKGPDDPEASTTSAGDRDLSPANSDTSPAATVDSEPPEPGQAAIAAPGPTQPEAPTAASDERPGPVRGGNVVPIRTWNKEPRAVFAITAAPNFTKPPSHSPTVEDTPANTGQRSGGSVETEELVALSLAERNAFREIARALGARGFEKTPVAGAPPPDGAASPGDQPPPEETATAATASVTEPSAAPAQGAEDSSALDNISGLLERLDSGLIVSRDGVPAFVNRTMLDMLGFDTIEDFHTSGGAERMFRGRDPGALTRDTEGGAIPVMAANGEILALKGRFQSIEWDGEPATLMTFRRTQEPDLTAKIRSLELELRQREIEARETHAILDTATDGVVLVDENGQILSLNKSGQALFGYDQNEVAGEVLTVLFEPESHAPVMDYLNGLKSNGVKSVLNDGREVLGRASQGGAIPLFMTLGRAGSSIPPRYCAVLRDLTQWKKVERDLSDAKRDAERASSLKSDFLAKISHEIRTPLNAILGFTEVIMDERFGAIGNERYKDYLKDIHSSGAHVLSLVNDLLDLSKIEAGKLDLNFGSVDANKVVNECVSLIQTQATRDRVIIRLSLAPRLPNIVADERSLRQIVINILSNAVKFNDPGGQVIVSTALTDAGNAVIRIRDTGIGMNDKELEMALEPFRQIAIARQITGTGLGLPLTKALVEANRASFTIKSRKGEGTLVEVSFPQTRVLAE